MSGYASGYLCFLKMSIVLLYWGFVATVSEPLIYTSNCKQGWCGSTFGENRCFLLKRLYSDVGSRAR